MVRLIEFTEYGYLIGTDRQNLGRQKTVQKIVQKTSDSLKIRHKNHKNCHQNRQKISITIHKLLKVPISFHLSAEIDTYFGY